VDALADALEGTGDPRVAFVRLQRELDLLPPWAPASPPDRLVDALLDDVARHPADETPWLVLADWLEERGEPGAPRLRLLGRLRALGPTIDPWFVSNCCLPWPRFPPSFSYARWSEPACRVMQRANREAQRRNHDHLGTQHLLLGLLRDDFGPATRSLTDQGVSLARARAAVEQITPTGPDMVLGLLPQTPRLKAALLYAWQEVEALGRNAVQAEHLLLGLCRAGPGVSARVMQALGASPRRACEQVVASLGQDPRRWAWAHPETW
jgi:uncharacterized protein (TIGR02996 family)